MFAGQDGADREVGLRPQEGLEEEGRAGDQDRVAVRGAGHTQVVHRRPEQGGSTSSLIIVF